METIKRLFGNVLFLWVLLGALVLFTLVGWLKGPKDRGLEETHALQEQLTRMRAADQKLIDSLRAAGQTASVNGAIVAGRAAQQLVAANRQKVRTEALVKKAESVPLTPADTTARLWKDAYDARTIEVDTLRQALASKDSAYREATRSANLFRLAADTSEGRRRSLEKVNADLAAYVKKAERGCRFLFISCPTRTQSAIAGVAIGAATLLVLESHKP